MSDSTKTFYFPENNGGNCCASMMSMLAPLIQRSGIDPGVLALMNNGGMGSNNGWWLIFVLLLWGRNGWGGYGGGDGSVSVPQMLSNAEGRDYLMQAINGNSAAVNSLASTLNCDINSVKTALNAIQSSICSVGNQVGMSGQQIINAVQAGNTGIIQQLCNCCCDVKNLVNTQGYEARINNLQQSQLIQNGFNQIGYASAEQTCALKQNANDNTNAIIAKLDAIEDSRKDREIATLTAQLTACNSRAERQAELAPIYKSLNDIQCKQVDTISVPYSPVTAIPNCVAYNAMLGAYGYPFSGGRSGQIWS